MVEAVTEGQTQQQQQDSNAAAAAADAAGESAPAGSGLKLRRIPAEPPVVPVAAAEEVQPAAAANGMANGLHKFEEFQGSYYPLVSTTAKGGKGNAGQAEQQQEQQQEQQKVNGGPATAVVDEDSEAAADES